MRHRIRNGSGRNASARMQSDSLWWCLRQSVIENHDAGYQNQHAEQRRPAVSATIKNPTNSDQERTESLSQSTREWARLAVEIVALLGLIWYARSASIQAKAAVDEVDAAVEANRGFLLLSSEVPKNAHEFFQGSQENVWVVCHAWQNFGRTPVTDVLAVQDLFVSAERPKFGKCPSQQAIHGKHKEFSPKPTTGLCLVAEYK